MEAPQINRDIQEQLTALIKKNFPHSPKVISPKLSLIQDLNADSLDMVDFILSLEDTFDIEILDEELEALSTMDSLQQLVVSKLEKKSAHL